ncbi:hypothetical protein QKC54_gp0162 [Megavirus baoshan]|uniref:DUF5894 domain-containing protein n=1 Tax=Megavirus baoshan TaxID=2496520 RepID=A0A3S8UY67_9VIRU|nr:hypothetical protein QKC54_gp0162 [Megavirus baoshan]AZL89755.1 hypothetical protein Mb0910 [Megavirus baoshan]
MDTIFDMIRPILDTISSTWYFNMFQQSIHKESTLDPSIDSPIIGKNIKSLTQILTESEIIPGQILLVEINNNNEQRAVCAWATFNKFSCRPIRSDYFHDLGIFQCTNCKCYFSKIIANKYSNYVDCPNICGAYYDDDIDDSYVRYCGPAFNAVIIGKRLPMLSKKEIKGYHFNQRFSIIDIKLLDNIKDRNVKILNLVDFDDIYQDEYNDKYYFRNIDSNL